ncbi:U32 family peptidase [Clostridiaceae bacterium M8S5]|nr:U32 family peptidase [Clostridiaceae bacterium M8S5]
MKRDIEILAPVGSMESLYAAVKNGANAVYLGGKLFNARQYASNFNNEEMKTAVELAHLCGVRVYVTLNILLNNEELKQAIDYIIFLYNIDVDAIIVQDMGLVKIVQIVLPDFELHASTQMTINNYRGVQFLEDCGFKRVVLAREVEFDDIKDIKSKTHLELEGFIHGALCVSYSGQCLMSSLIGQRSGNRGRCAQPCRMTYSLVDLESGEYINESLINKYILSLKDLMTIEQIRQIVDSGLMSLKIEGRMKRPEYVATIVSKYRKALDRVSNKGLENITSQDIKEMKQAFNRGFTKGFILGEKSPNMVSLDRANNKGIYLGIVTRVKKDRYITIKLDEDLHKGDGIQFVDEGMESKGMKINKITVGGKVTDHAKRGKSVDIPYISGVYASSKVMKTSDYLLNQKAADTYKDIKTNKTKSLNLFIKLKKGETPVLTACDDNNNYVQVNSDYIIEEARKKPTTADIINKQLSKAGNSIFTIDEINIDMDDNIIVPVSKLNQLRREAIEKLENINANFNKRKIINVSKINKEELLKLKNNDKKSSKKLSISVNTLLQLKQLDLTKVDRLYVRYFDGLDEYLMEHIKDIEVYIRTDRIISNNQIDSVVDKITKIKNIDGICVSNYGMLNALKNTDYILHIDEGFNIFNNYSIDYLSNYRANSFTYSLELSLEQIKEMSNHTISCSESVVYGYYQTMITKYCPISKVIKCTDCNQCTGKKLGLKDRIGKIFPFRRNGDYTIIYNSEPLMMLEYLHEFKNMNVDYLRLDFTIEDSGIREIQTVYYDYLNSFCDKQEVKEFVKEFKKKTQITKGHYYRGVL